MSRRTTAKKRVVNPDSIYRSRLVTMVQSRLLLSGKKSIAAKLFYDAMEHIERGGKAGDSGAAADSAGRVGGTTSSRLRAPDSTQKKGEGETGTEQAATSGLKVFQNAVLNVTPVVEVKSRRVGGSNYQVPLEVSSERGTSLALRWLVQAARQRPGREMAMKLASEFIDASNKTGNAMRKREETHRIAESNKAFANYRF